MLSEMLFEVVAVTVNWYIEHTNRFFNVPSIVDGHSMANCYAYYCVSRCSCNVFFVIVNISLQCRVHAG